MDIYDLKSQLFFFFLSFYSHQKNTWYFRFIATPKQTHKVNNLILGILEARENCTGTEVVSWAWPGLEQPLVSLICRTEAVNGNKFFQLEG